MLYRKIVLLVLSFLFFCILPGCAKGFWSEFFEDSRDFIGIQSIALLGIEYKKAYRKMPVSGLYVAYSNVLRKKGYNVVERLEVEDKLLEKGLDLNKILDNGTYSSLVEFADAGMLVSFQENLAGTVSCNVLLVNFTSGDVVWQKTAFWEQYKTLQQIPIVSELERFFTSFPYAFL